MQERGRSRASVAARGIAAMGIAAMAASPLAPITESHSPPTTAPDVRLAAATSVPPGGLVTSFLGNQVIYCSIICPLLAETVVTASATTLQTPGTFLAAVQSGNLLQAIGATAASVTGPTNTAAQATILADGTLVAPRALNAFQVGVVGLLNIVPAAAGGLPGIAAAIQTARQDTFTALNLPIVPNPTPTVMPRGVVQVAVVSVINVGAAVIFPAFNHVLSAAFATPDAVAQELAATGDPVRAVTAGVNTAAGELTAAGAAIADSVDTAVRDIRAAIEQSPSESLAPASPTPGNPTARAQTSVASTKAERDVDERGSKPAHRTAASRTDPSSDKDEETGARDGAERADRTDGAESSPKGGDGTESDGA